jgi:sulfoxide reductase heme-binding subunit YedZ
VAAALVPLALLAAAALHGGLGANPIETIEHRTGDWTLRFLLAALAVTPLRRFSRWNGVIRYRRTLGLIAYGYACVHFLAYVGLDEGLDLPSIADDILKRPYVTVGFTALCLLTPLAFTSTTGWIRRLGGKRWNALHRLIYVAGAAAILHYLWEVKGDQLTPVYYALVLVLLLGLRMFGARRAATATSAIAD